MCVAVCVCVCVCGCVCVCVWVGPQESMATWHIHRYYILTRLNKYQIAHCRMTIHACISQARHAHSHPLTFHTYPTLHCPHFYSTLYPPPPPPCDLPCTLGTYTFTFAPARTRTTHACANTALTHFGTSFHFHYSAIHVYLRLRLLFIRRILTRLCPLYEPGGSDTSSPLDWSSTLS